MPSWRDQTPPWTQFFHPLFFFKFSFLSPPLVFTFEPRKTIALAILPLAITDFFIAFFFIAFAFIAFAFMAFFIAFMAFIGLVFIALAFIATVLFIGRAILEVAAKRSNLNT